MPRRLSDWALCVTGCAALVMLGVFLEQRLRRAPMPELAIQAPPSAAEEPAPRDGDPKQADRPVQDSLFHLAAFAAPAEKEIKESFDDAKAGGLATHWAQW